MNPELLKSKEEVQIIKDGGKILGRILKDLLNEAKPGISTEYLENLACEWIAKAGGRPAFKNYEVWGGHFFPTALCTSINEEIVHAPAIPGRILKNGDILSIDIGMEWPTDSAVAKKYKVSNRFSFEGGFYTDTAGTVAVGQVDGKTKKLIETTRQALAIGIKEARPGNTLSNLGKAIQKYVEKKGFSVVRDLVGHGVGFKVHEDEPQVFNYDFTQYGIPDMVLVPGMVIAIEPMVNIGGWKIKNSSNSMAIVTADGSLSAHFEHTVAITEKGNIVITE
jgi:methionyl aminopeptidase